MKKYIVLIVGILCSVAIGCQNEETGSDSETAQVIEGPYLGMNPPGDVPELFAPGIVADIYGEHSAAAFTPDGKEVFWSRIINAGQNPRIVVVMHMEQENGVWSQPKLASFNKGFYNFVRSISPDGKRLYVGSVRPLEEGGERPAQSTDWVVDKTEDGWGEARLAEQALRWPEHYSYVRETNSGTLYYSGPLATVEREWALFRSKLVDGEYQRPEALGATINSQHLDYAFCIDPDEKFVIFASNRPGSLRGTDLYISYHQPDDTWGEAINLGEKINAAGAGGSDWPCLSPDGKYLFFLTSVDAYDDYDMSKFTYEELQAISTSIMNGHLKIYWVNTSFVDELRPVGD